MKFGREWAIPIDAEKPVDQRVKSGKYKKSVRRRLTTDKELKDNLWHSADVLRSGAHLAANKYGQPILGLIFLR